jgi:hypothetical protein
MTDQAVAISPDKAGAIMEAVIVKGDLAQLTPLERAKYYRTVCESIGLNPLTKPFEYITLNGKLTLYARKDATDQLRRHYGVSVVEMTDLMLDGITVVTVKVRDSTGRTDMAKGAVSLKGLQGEALANAIMKAETKAKRRATLSICGLGFFDESEIDEEMPTDVKRYTKTKQAAKELFSALQAEVHTLTSALQAKTWLEQSADKLSLLPRDWEDYLRTNCADMIRSEVPTEVWDEDGVIEPEETSAWDALGPVKQAGMLCGDDSFLTFLRDRIDRAIADAGGAAEYVRKHCEITSRKDLASDTHAAGKWRALVADYRAWQREPQVVDTVSSQVGTHATEEAGPVSTPSPTAGPADEIPTLAECDIALDLAAKCGSATLAECWKTIPREHKATLKAALDRRHKPTAAQADQQAVIRGIEDTK